MTELTIEQALQQGIAAHKAGKLQEAERFYRAILNVQPQHPDANHNLGVVAVAVGKVEAALPLFKTALEANPGTEQFWFSCINALIKLDHLEKAKKVLEQAKTFGFKGDKFDEMEEQFSNTATNTFTDFSSASMPSKQQIDSLASLYAQGHFQEALVKGTELEKQFPSDPIIINILGAVQSELGAHEQAISSYNKAIDLKPDYAEGYYNLGNTLNEVGRHEEAVSNFKRAIELKSTIAEAHNNLGNALSKLDKLEDAISSYNKAIDLRPDYAEGYYNLGNTLNEVGRYEEAVSSYNKAIELKPNYPVAFNNLGNVLSVLKCNNFSEHLANNYLDVLNFGNIVKPAFLIGAIIRLLKHHDAIKEAISFKEQNAIKNVPPELLIRIAQIPLFIKIMQICPIPDLEIEEILTEFRKILLLNREKLSTSFEILSFQSALALQCFTNEFIYEETKEEEEAVNCLVASMEKSLANQQELSLYDIACLASYRSLADYSWTVNIKFPGSLKLLFRRQVIDVNRELALKKGIPRLTHITDDVSLAVQNQYEENPYPRWINTKLEIEPLSIKELMAKLELQITYNKSLATDFPQILVAGCGTGQHSLRTASRFKNSQVTAIDLSLSSLAYAKRKTEELNVTNVEYLQADILNLGMLDKRFDVIESAGVLVCMADPVAGWKVLSNCLKPGGIMKIGLYSELARRHIVKARRMIAEQNIRADREEMLKFRRYIGKLEDPEINILKEQNNFYSTSELRDLIFHVQEHRFTIPQIKKILVDLGLKFIGFEFADKSASRVFKLSYPQQEALYDLEKWHEFEMMHPSFFIGMYQTWVQKM